MCVYKYHYISIHSICLWFEKSGSCCSFRGQGYHSCEQLGHFPKSLEKSSLVERLALAVGLGSHHEKGSMLHTLVWCMALSDLLVPAFSARNCSRWNMWLPGFYLPTLYANGACGKMILAYLALTTWNKYIISLMTYIECLCHRPLPAVLFQSKEIPPPPGASRFSGPPSIVARDNTISTSLSIFPKQRDANHRAGLERCWQSTTVTGCSYSWRLSSNRLMARLSCRWLRDTESSQVQLRCLDGDLSCRPKAKHVGFNGWTQPSVHGSWTSPNEQSSPSPCGIGSGSLKNPVIIQLDWPH